jgi:tyrosyl-tRNA synthetase
VEGYLKIFTFKTRGEIDELVATQRRDPASRAAQRYLAADMTTRVHGGEAAVSADRASQVLFGELDVREAPRSVLEMLSKEIPTAPLAPASEVGLVDAVVSAGLATSKGEARRLIEQGAVYVNGDRETDVNRKLGQGDWPEGHVLLRKGKKDYALLRAG